MAPARHFSAGDPAIGRWSSDRPSRHGGSAARWLAGAAVGLLGLLLGPASAEVIWEGRDQSVLLAPQDDPGAPPNDHPVRLAAGDIETMLADLRFRFADQQADAPPAVVFNKEQVDILGEALATALSKATPAQDVTFSVIGAHRLSPGAFARRNRVTAGRVFYREGKLNLILGEIQSPHRKKNVYGRIEQDFHPRRYGSREVAGEHESRLVASPLASLRGGAGSAARHDWAIFDANAARSMRTAGSESAVADPPAKPSASPAAASESPDGRAPAPQPEGGAAGQDIEQRLETLKRLRDRDLISEEAYRQRVDEILDEL